MHERRRQEGPWSGRERGTAGTLGWGWILLWREMERTQPAEATGQPRAPSPPGRTGMRWVTPQPTSGWAVGGQRLAGPPQGHLRGHHGRPAHGGAALGSSEAPRAPRPGAGGLQVMGRGLLSARRRPPALPVSLNHSRAVRLHQSAQH